MEWVITHPAEAIKKEIEKEKRSKGLQFCFAYYKDLDEAYAFYCARYKNISFDEFLKLPLSEFNRKISSVPESEPLYTIMKSRAINTNTIKDKNEKKYWETLKRENKIPYAYYNNNDTTPVNLGGILW